MTEETTEETTEEMTGETIEEILDETEEETIEETAVEMTEGGGDGVAYKKSKKGLIQVLVRIHVQRGLHF